MRVDPPTPDVTSHTGVLHSRILAEERPFTVYLPRGFDRQPDRTYPVMIVLDGGAYGGLMAETLHLMRIRGGAPAVITVAVPNIDRRRDFLPFPVDYLPTSGGAGPFLSFLADELVPWIESEYRGNGYRILFGHSFGGLLATYALVCRPEVCQAALAASPALYYDRGRTLRTIEKILTSRPPAGPRYLFLSMADELIYAESIDFLQGRLDSLATGWLRRDEIRYPGESHVSMVLHALPDALEGLFAGWNLPPEVEAQGREPIRAHFAELTARMGYEVEVPEELVNRLGYAALGRGETDAALDLFRWNTERFPASANTWDSLAEALLAAGDRDGAVARYRQALAVDPDFAPSREALARLGAAGGTPGPGG